LSFGIKYQKCVEGDILYGFSDADWAGDKKHADLPQVIVLSLLVALFPEQNPSLTEHINSN
jgi:hypothetical protein